MSIEIIHTAIEKGAVLYPNVSGGKDGQAMVKTLHNNGMKMEALIHAHLGQVEWTESMGMCRKLAESVGVPLTVVTRTDGRGLLDHWKVRLVKLKGTGKPFWSSSQARYCTSDLKREPIDQFYRNCGFDFVISCEGIRGQESKRRAKKVPLTIRSRVTSKYYRGMTVEEAIAAYKPGKRLVLTWYPVFGMSLDEVWMTYGMDAEGLRVARERYKYNGELVAWWPFHPAYAYGNDRVSCVFCVLGSTNDLKNGAKHRPELLDVMIQMEEEGGATFKDGFSLKELK